MSNNSLERTFNALQECASQGNIAGFVRILGYQVYGDPTIPGQTDISPQITPGIQAAIGILEANAYLQAADTVISPTRIQILEARAYACQHEADVLLGLKK